MTTGMLERADGRPIDRPLRDVGTMLRRMGSGRPDARALAGIAPDHLVPRAPLSGPRALVPQDRATTPKSTSPPGDPQLKKAIELLEASLKAS
jgi:hypothetical protein